VPVLVLPIMVGSLVNWLLEAWKSRHTGAGMLEP
jgi:hypothetical protein